MTYTNLQRKKLRKKEIIKLYNELNSAKREHIRFAYHLTLMKYNYF